MPTKLPCQSNKHVLSIPNESGSFYLSHHMQFYHHLVQPQMDLDSLQSTTRQMITDFDISELQIIQRIHTPSSVKKTTFIFR